MHIIYQKRDKLHDTANKQEGEKMQIITNAKFHPYLVLKHFHIGLNIWMYLNQHKITTTQFKTRDV